MESVYLDNNATTPLDPVVLDAMIPFLTKWNGNAASAHVFGWEAEAAIDQAREQVAALVGANPEEVVFTSGATEANNWFLKKFACDSPRTIFTSKIEHKSVLVPLNSCEDDVRLFSVDATGAVDFSSVSTDRSGSTSTNVVSLMGVNNEIHTVLDFSAARQFCDQTQAVLHSDVTQMVGRLPVDIRTLGLDAISLSSHKIYGPQGVGALCTKRSIHPQLNVLIEGGGQEQGRRAGTVPVPLVVGFGKACELAKASLEKERNRLENLVEVFLTQLEWHRLSFELFGPPDYRCRQPGSLSLLIDGFRADRICEWIPEISVSQASACNNLGSGSHVLHAIGVDPERQTRVFRLSFGRFNTREHAVLAANRFADIVQGKGA